MGDVVPLPRGECGKCRTELTEDPNGRVTWSGAVLLCQLPAGHDGQCDPVLRAHLY